MQLGSGIFFWGEKKLTRLEDARQKTLKFQKKSGVVWLQSLHEQAKRNKFEPEASNGKSNINKMMAGREQIFKSRVGSTLINQTQLT